MANDLWSTPPEVFNALDQEFGFGFDVCAEHETAKCSAFWTIEDDALQQNWLMADYRMGRKPQKPLWCNPPYSSIGPWVDKALEAQAAGRCVVMLVMCDPSVKWFSKAQQYASETRFITNGRLAFLKDGVPQKGNNKGSVIFVFDPHRISAGHVSFIERDDLLVKGQIQPQEQAA